MYRTASVVKPVITAIIASFILTLASAALAETRYVTDVLVVSIRDAADETSKPSKYVRSGTAMEVLEENDQFARVRLQDGAEGWISKRYLTTAPPKDQRIDALEKELASYKAGGAAPVVSQEELSRLKSELKAANAQIESLKSQGEAISNSSAELETLKTENALLKRQVSLIGQTLTFFKNKDVLAWFLSGAGVLLAGWLIGRSARGGRRY